MTDNQAKKPVTQTDGSASGKLNAIKPPLAQVRSSPDMSASDRKKPNPMSVPSLNLGPTTAGSPGLRPINVSSAPNTPEAASDKKRPTPTSRFLSKEKLLFSGGNTTGGGGPGTPNSASRKRGGSFLTAPATATPPIKPRNKPLTISTTPPLDSEYDYDFSKAFMSSPELSRKDEPVDVSPSSEKKVPSVEDSPTPSPQAGKRKPVAANPLIADKASQWGQSDRLEDWVRMINTTADDPMSRAGDEAGGAIDDEASTESSSGSSSDEEDSDVTSSSGSNESSATEVSEVFSKDSRQRFLEEEDEVISSSESLNGSRISRSQPPLTADVVRLRAAKELEVLASLVPARVLYAHLSGQRPRGQLRAMREEFDGAVLFADISGFSRLAELLVRRQTPSNAAESLTKYVGWNLHEMVEVICSKGGDVMKFAGDAILAVFAADQFDGSLPKAAVCCAQAALSLQGLELSAGDAKLSVHSGMGVGRVATYEVGGLQDRWEVFVAGPPVEQIGRCEPQAKAGELVVSFEARQCMEKLVRIRGQMIEDGNFRLDKVLDPIDFKERPAASKELSTLAVEDPDKAVELKRTLQKYLSRPVIFSIEGHGQTLWGAELRVCSTLFVKFKGLRFTEQTEEDLALVQYVVKHVVQKVMADLEGTVCRFMVDDKGAAMLLAFGLIPFCHANDSARAVKAALMIRDGVAALSLAKPQPITDQKRHNVTRKSAEEEPVKPVALNVTSEQQQQLQQQQVPPAFPVSADMRDLLGRKTSQESSQVGSGASSSPSRPVHRKRSSSKHRMITEDPSVVRTFLTKEYAPIPKQPVSCQIGITRGKVCVGMVGGSTRCEYTLHGVLVNRAARLMGSATDAKILCDHDTYTEARNEVEFDVNPVTLQLKGERKQVKVFVPVRKSTTARQRGGNRSTVAIDTSKTATKANQSKNDDEDAGFVGRQKERQETDLIFKKLSAETPWSGVIGVQGDSGVGKSRMLQYVARAAKKHRVTVLSGFALDTEANTPFFVWKSVVIQLVSISAMTKANPGTTNAAAAAAAAVAQAAATMVLQSVSSKETMTSFGSSHSFGSVGFASPNTKTRKARSGSVRHPSSGSPAIGSIGPSPAAATIGSITTQPTELALPAAQQYRMGSPKGSNAQKKFDEMSPEEKKDCLIDALPLEKRELYPLLAPFVDEIIPQSLLADNDTTTNIVRNQRVSVAIETVVAMVSYMATRLQQKGERLCIILEDLQFVDVPSLDLLLQVAKSVPRLAIFCSGTFSEENGMSQRVPCTYLWTLPRLERNEIARCMRLWLNVAKVSDAAVNMIYEKSNGNPLFSEELCRLMNDNHYFEIANDTCALTNIGASGETRMTLPNSIIALMTASLDRLDASQQIVLRVVSVMGMQFSLHDLAGVLRAINKVSTAKLFGGDKYSNSKNIKFDIKEEELTLAQVLKEGNSSKSPPQQNNTTSTSSSVESSSSSVLQTGKPKASSTDQVDETAGGANGNGSDFTSIKVNVNQVLTSLEKKGILEQRSGFGARKVYVFRHAMMKETACDELLREESKQSLHKIIGEYYEERPGTDLAQWYATLAEHFFATPDKVKARKYLELAGEGAVQNHATQQVYQCYSRLMKLAGSEDVPLLVRAQWSRKVGEALYHMDRYLQAEEYLHKALEVLRLDCRDAPALSGTEAGFFPKSSAGCFGPGSNEESVILRQRPSGWLGWLRRNVFNSAMDEDDEYAEEFERFIIKSDLDDENGSGGAVGGGSTLSHQTANGQAGGGGGSFSSRNSNPIQPQDQELNAQPSKRSSTLRLAANGGSNSTKMKPRQRTMSMVEPQSPLRPRLLLSMESFQQYKRQVEKGATQLERNEALAILLEGALVYDLLGRLLRDRSSSVALERRLNAILLAEAAASSLNDQFAHVTNAKKKKKQAKGWMSAISTRKSKASSGSGSDQQQMNTFLSSAEVTLSQFHSITLGGGGTTNQQAAPTISPAQQRVLDELSRAYSRAAVFFAGMHPGTRWRGLAKPYAFKANSFLQNHAISRTDLAAHSENLVLLQQRCGEYDAMQGNFMDACEKLRFAVWGARFMHLDRARVDSKVLELTVFFFNGDMDSCNTTACELFEKNTSPKNVALGARFMALCGEYDIAAHKLRSLAKLNGPLGGTNEEELSFLERGLESLGEANAWLALSLVAWRKDQNGKLAVKAFQQAAELALCSELSDAPLPMFHTLALCFTALWDPVRESDGEVLLVEEGRDMQLMEQLLKRLLSVVRSYAVVYKVCRPHALYCVALRTLILSRLQHFILLKKQPLSDPAAAPQPLPIVVEEETLYQPRLGSSCFPMMKSSKRVLDPFEECALLAHNSLSHWIEGLARLEMDDVDSWLYARDIFSQYNHAEYELVRCEKRLADAGIFPAESEEDQDHAHEGALVLETQ